MAVAYYNEIDPYAAQWLRNLIAAGHIAPGDVDTRSIEDVKPDELKKYTQCHFFAGIGGWSHALRLAEWPDDRPVWTGSCPCQPFSAAGKGAGFADERHLWPAFFHLIRECGPGIIFGEQVASAADWIDLVSTDLEAEDYAFGASVLGAHSVGAPHQRQRVYWVANAEREQRKGRLHGRGLDREAENCRQTAELTGRCAVGGVGNAVPKGLPLREPEAVFRARWWHEGRAIEQSSGSSSFWSNAEWLDCRDGKKRPTKLGIFPLAYGVPGRVGKLRAAGNAIVPQCAEELIRSFMELLP